MRDLSKLLTFVSAIFATGFAVAQVANAPSSGASEPGLTVNAGTVAQTLEKAKALPGASVATTKPDAWVIVNEAGGMKVWSFTRMPNP